MVAHRYRLGRIEAHDPAHDAAHRSPTAPVAAFVHGDGTQPDIEWPRRIIPPHGEPGGRIGFLKHIMGLGLVADVAANEPIKVALGGGHQDGEGDSVSACRANLNALLGSHARRLAGVMVQRIDDCFVEHLGLGRGQYGSHLEDMGDRRLLEIAHGGVEMIHRRLNLRRVALAGGNGGGQFTIGGADLGLQRRSLSSEAGFNDVKATVLIRAQIEFFMDDAVKVGRLPLSHDPGRTRPGRRTTGQRR